MCTTVSLKYCLKLEHNRGLFLYMCMVDICVLQLGSGIVMLITIPCRCMHFLCLVLVSISLEVLVSTKMLHFG